MDIKDLTCTKSYSTIIIYSTGCPKCNILKKKLDEKGILYNENHSVEEMKLLGIKEVPVLKAQGILMSFNEAIQWINNI